MSKLDFQFLSKDIEAVVHWQEGAIEKILMILKVKLESYFSSQLKDSLYIPPPISHSGIKDSQLKDSHPKDQAAKAAFKQNDKGKENLFKAESIDESTKNSNVVKYMLPEIKQKPKLSDTKKKTVMLDNYEAIIADKSRKISELTEAMNLMENKLRNVEELLMLKDEKIKILKRGLKKG